MIRAISSKYFPPGLMSSVAMPAFTTAAPCAASLGLTSGRRSASAQDARRVHRVGFDLFGYGRVSPPCCEFEAFSRALVVDRLRGGGSLRHHRVALCLGVRAADLCHCGDKSWPILRRRSAAWHSILAPRNSRSASSLLAGFKPAAPQTGVIAQVLERPIMNGYDPFLDYRLKPALGRHVIFVKPSSLVARQSPWTALTSLAFAVSPYPCFLLR
jgi:hypothetical protein